MNYAKLLHFVYISVHMQHGYQEKHHKNVTSVKQQTGLSLIVPSCSLVCSIKKSCVFTNIDAWIKVDRKWMDIKWLLQTKIVSKLRATCKLANFPLQYSVLRYSLAVIRILPYFYIGWLSQMHMFAWKDGAVATSDDCDSKIMSSRPYSVWNIYKYCTKYFHKAVRWQNV